jgi:hypothetical protein
MSETYAGYDEIRQAERARRSNGHAGAALRFRAEPFDAIEIGTEPEWLVRDIVLRTTSLTVIIGEPGCGKSFLAADLGLHVAMRKPWGGKSVEGGVVIYVTGEGASGFRKRLTAFRQHHRPGHGLPFYLIADVPRSRLPSR